MKARLGAYGAWQLRDFVFERAAAIVIIGLLLTFGTYESINPTGRAFLAANPSEALAFGARGVAEHLGLLWFITSLIAVYGISANDRSTGRFRLMFAKPVRVVPYYAQAFALHGVAFMLCTLVWLATFSRVFRVGNQLAWDAVTILACSYMLVGGVCFLMSALWRFDWVGTVGVFGAVMYLAAKFPKAAWLGPLPPFWRVSEQIDNVKTLDPLDVKILLWVVAYGVACFLLGLIILKRRPLAT